MKNFSNNKMCSLPTFFRLILIVLLANALHFCMNFSFLATSISYAAQPAKDITLTNPKTLEEDLKKYRTSWVHFTSYEEYGDNKKRVKEFWTILKREFGSQVEAFITVDTNGWEKAGYGILIKEVTTGARDITCFGLYKDGVLYANPVRVLIIDIPKRKVMESWIPIIKKNSFLE